MLFEVGPELAEIFGLDAEVELRLHEGGELVEPLLHAQPVEVGKHPRGEFRERAH